MTGRDTGQLAAELEAVLGELLHDCRVSRCTLRIDDPAHGWDTGQVAAQALQPGVSSLRAEGAIERRSDDTVQWLARERRKLVQADLMNAPVPAPPAALMDRHAIAAQMMAPLLDRDGHLQGWISVHCEGGMRNWTAGHIAALDKARTASAALLGLPPQ